MSKNTFYDLSDSQINSIREYLTSHNKKIKNFEFPKSQKERIYDIIEKLQESDTQNMANLNDIITIAKITDINSLKAEDMINKMKNAGQLIEPRIGLFKIVS